MARLVPASLPRSGKRELGFAEGQISIADDFDAPLPDNVLKEWEAG